MNKCKHDNIMWSNAICMIFGFKKEGICIDCHKIMLKNINGEVFEKDGVYKQRNSTKD